MSRNAQSRIWVLRFDAPEKLTEKRFLTAFGFSTRVAGRVMLSTTATESHPDGYRHIHAVIQSRTGSPIKKTTVWRQIRRLLHEADPDAYPEDRSPSIYCDKPKATVTAALDYCLKDEKTDDEEAGGKRRGRVRARRLRALDELRRPRLRGLCEGRRDP